eukprot:sb/3465744/
MEGVLRQYSAGTQHSSGEYVGTLVRPGQLSSPFQHSEVRFLDLHDCFRPSYCDENPQESKTRCKVAVEVSLAVKDEEPWPLFTIKLVEDREILEGETDAHFHQDPDFLQHVFVDCGYPPRYSRGSPFSKNRKDKARSNPCIILAYHFTYSRTPIYRDARGKGFCPVNRGARYIGVIYRIFCPVNRDRGNFILPVNRGSGKSGPGKSGFDCISYYVPWDPKDGLTSGSLELALFLFEEAAYILKERNNRDLQDVLSTKLGELSGLRLALVNDFISREPNQQEYVNTDLCLSLASINEATVLYEWLIENFESKPHPVKLTDVEKSYHFTYSRTPIYRDARGKGFYPVNRGARYIGVKYRLFPISGEVYPPGKSGFR